MDASNLKNVLQRAKRLTDMDASGQINMIAENARNSGKMNYNDTDAIPSVNQTNYQPVYQNFSEPRRNSSMPKEILESFRDNPINVPAGGMGASSSVLDDLGIVNENFQQPVAPKAPKRVITENNNSHQPVYQSSSNVDYSLIKDIVESAVKKYMGAYVKKMMTEGKQNISSNDKIKAVQFGDKFSFVTENGDLYTASLEFVKNIKKNKA